jgi:hypothetical protein
LNTQCLLLYDLLLTKEHYNLLNILLLHKSLIFLLSFNTSVYFVLMAVSRDAQTRIAYSSLTVDAA